MKKSTHFLRVIICIFIMPFVSVSATDTLTIYQNGFVTARIPVSGIDSLNFNPTNGAMNYEDFVNAPDAAYSQLVNWNLMNNSSHDSFGIMSILHATDMMTEDIVMSKLSHFRFDYYLDNYQFNYRRPIMIWGYLHDIIIRSNNIIQAYPSNNTSNNLRYILGQAYAMRGYAYYYLVQLFQFTAYTQNPANLDLPTIALIYASKEGKNNKLYRVPAKEVLAQIESDLTKAIDYLNGYGRENKNQINQNVAYGLLARYYLLTGQWNKAVSAARSAMNGYDIMPATNLKDGFMNIFNSEWIWGFDHNSETTSIYASFFSHISNLSAGYAGLEYAPRHIDKRLYDNIPATDARRELFQDAVGSITNTPPKQASATGWKLPYANLKFGWLDGFIQDYPYMRTSEMVLIEAEALARQSGMSGQAAIALNKLMQQRDPSWNKTNISVEDVLLQRRIELWGEGFSYFDLKRLSIGIDRNYNQSNHESGAKIAVAANDIRWNFQIPQNALDQYPGMGETSKMPNLSAPILLSNTGTSMIYESTIQNIDLSIQHTKGLKYTTDPTFTNNVITTNASYFNNSKLSDTIESLKPQTTYYTKAYYSSTYGTALSPVMTFTTTSLQLPVVSLNIVSLNETSISVSGIIQFDGLVIEKGFELGLDSTFSAGKISQKLSGDMNYEFTNLTKGTTYFVRAFARATDGITYSKIIETKTTGALVVKTLPYTILSSDNLETWQNSGITFIDGDGDGRVWEYAYYVSALQQIGLRSFSWYNQVLKPENYAILPPIQLGSSNATFSIDVKSFDTTYFKEKFKIFISDQPISNTELARNAEVLFTKILDDSGSKTYNIPIPAKYQDKTVWIGIAHFDSTDEYAIGITNIKVL
jgi:starch-binding outer membrane protein, SusD/RagB family